MITRSAIATPADYKLAVMMYKIASAQYQHTSVDTASSVSLHGFCAHFMYHCLSSLSSEQSLRSVLSDAALRLSGTHYLFWSLDATRCQCLNLD